MIVKSTIQISVDCNTRIGAYRKMPEGPANLTPSLGTRALCGRLSFPARQSLSKQRVFDTTVHIIFLNLWTVIRLPASMLESPADGVEKEMIGTIRQSSPESLISPLNLRRLNALVCDGDDAGCGQIRSAKKIDCREKPSGYYNQDASSISASASVLPEQRTFE